MGICITKIKNKKQEEIYKNIKYEDTKVYIPPIDYVYVCKVYDGDTFTIATKMPGSNEIYRFSVRIKGIDCPELRTKNSEEKEIAIIARDYLKSLIENNNNMVNLKNISYDKYGRLCSDVYIKDVCVKDKMLDNHLAVEYNGGTKILPLSWKDYYKNV